MNKLYLIFDLVQLLQKPPVMIKFIRTILIVILILTFYNCKDNSISSSNNQKAVNNEDISAPKMAAVRRVVNDLCQPLEIQPTNITQKDYVSFNNNAQVITGVVYSKRSKLSHSFIIKLDQKNNYIWGHIINDENIIIPNQVSHLKNGDLLLIGYHTQIEGRKYAQASSDMLIQKFSPTGEVLWQKVIKIEYHNEEAIIAQELDQASLLIVGLQHRIDKHIYCIKMNKEGKILWEVQSPFKGYVKNINIIDRPENIIVSGDLEGYHDDTTDITEPKFTLKITNSGKLESIKPPGKIANKNTAVVKKEKSANTGKTVTKKNPSKNKVLITTSNVIVRKEATTSSPVLGVLDQNDSCRVLDKSVRKDRIGSMNNYWYKLKYNNTIGWVYGAFVKFAE